MNTRSRNINSAKKVSSEIAIPFKLVLLLSSFILALLASWSLDGLFFTELFISGIIVCTLMWCREISLRMDSAYRTNSPV